MASTCQFCKREIRMGESVSGHAIQYHPKFFANALLSTSIGEQLLAFLNENMLDRPVNT